MEYNFENYTVKIPYYHHPEKEGKEVDASRDKNFLEQYPNANPAYGFVYIDDKCAVISFDREGNPVKYSESYYISSHVSHGICFEADEKYSIKEKSYDGCIQEFVEAKNTFLSLVTKQGVTMNNFKEAVAVTLYSLADKIIDHQRELTAS